MKTSDKIAAYLESTPWSPIKFLADKFDASREDISDAVEKLLMDDVDIRVERGFIHVS